MLAIENSSGHFSKRVLSIYPNTLACFKKTPVYKFVKMEFCSDSNILRGHVLLNICLKSYKVKLTSKDFFIGNFKFAASKN